MNKRSLIIAAVFSFLTLLLFVIGRISGPSVPPANPVGNSAPKRPNRLVFPIWDPKKGTKFEFVGILEEGSDFIVGKEPQHQTLKFGKGSVTIPFQPSGSGGKNAKKKTGTFRLEFEKAEYRALSGLSRAFEVYLPGSSVGVLDDGTTVTRIKFTSLKVRWHGSRNMRLETTEPVEITREEPYLLLRGMAGLTGRFSEKENAYFLRFPSPVRTWLHRTGGQAFLGLSGETGQASSVPDYLCIRCEGKGGLILDWSKNRIIFDQHVTISPTKKTEIPTGPQPRRFECHRLVVSFDPESKKLKRAQAERGPDSPVRGYWDTVTVEGGAVEWDALTDTAVLSQQPHLWGKNVELAFDATASKIIFDNKARRANLLGPINGNLKQTAPEKGLQLPSTWVLEADLAEVFFSESGRHRVTRIMASTDPTLPSPRGVRFETPDESVVATGGKLRYEVANRLMTVTGLPGQPPHLEMEKTAEAVKEISSGAGDLLSFRLTAWATRVNFSFPQGSIVLEEHARAKVVRKTRRNGELIDQLNADRVKIAGKSGSDRFVVEAWGKDAREPFALDYDGPPRCRLTGGHLVWNREADKARLLPYKEITRQSISLLGMFLECRELEFLPARAEASARTDVEVHIQSEQGEFVLTADRADAVIDPSAVGDQQPPTLNTLRELTASAAAGKKVTLRHEKLEAYAGRITFYAASGEEKPSRLVLSGGDRQVFRLSGPTGRDEIIAQTVEFRPGENRLLLSGGFSGTIHQRNWVEEGTLLEDRKAPRTPWKYQAQNGEVQFKKEGSRWELTAFRATGAVKLENPELQIRVSGTTVEFDPDTRTITLGSTSGPAARQTLSYGTPPKVSVLSARRIRIVRKERLVGARAEPEIIVDLTRDVTCYFYLRTLPLIKKVPAYAPEKFEVTADRVFFVVPAAGKLPSTVVSYAHAVGNVMFKAYDEDSKTGATTKEPPWRGFGAQAYYRSSPFTFTLLGEGTTGKATLEGPVIHKRAHSFELRLRPDGTLWLIKSGPGVDFQAPDPIRAIPKTITTKE